MLSLSERTNQAAVGGKETMIIFFNLLQWILESAKVGYQ